MNEENPYLNLASSGAPENPYLSALPSAMPKSSENFLQKAIKQSRIGSFGGTSITAAVPTSGEEGTDLMKVIGRQIPMTRGQDVGFPTMGPSGLGFEIAGIKQASPLVQPPTTEYGKNLETSADIAQWAPISTSVIGGGVKGIGNLISKNLRTAPIKKNILSNLKSGRTLSYEGAETIKRKVPEMIKNANIEYGKTIENVPARLTREDVHQIIDKTLADADLGDRTMLTEGEKFFSNLKNTLPETSKTVESKILGPSGKPIVETSDLSKKGMYIEDWKAIVKHVRKGVSPQDPMLTMFYKNAEKHLSSKFPELVSANLERAPLYETAKSARKINRGTLGRLARGGQPQSEVADLMAAEKPIGTSFVQKASQLGTERERLASELGRVKGNKVKAQWAAGIAGAGALAKFLDSMFGGK